MRNKKFSYTVKEEFGNTLTHSIGVILSIIGTFIIIIDACIYNNSLLDIVASIIFSCSLLIMYSTSTLYHFIKKRKLKKLFQKLDHCAIYILIAGSYTPFTLITLHNHSGIQLFIFIWLLAIIGIFIENSTFKNSFYLSMILYIVMGWSVLAFFQPLYNLLDIHGLYLLILGGLFYTFGIIFFVWQKIPYNHTIWHIFVLGGSISHYFAILNYVI